MQNRAQRQRHGALHTVPARERQWTLAAAGDSWPRQRVQEATRLASHLIMRTLLVLHVWLYTIHAAPAPLQTTTNRQGQSILSIPLVPHHVHRRRLSIDEPVMAEHRPRRRHLDGDLQVASLFQGYGTHYADLWCGTPPQRQTVIVDTGSGVTAFPCSGCDDCGVPKYHIDQLFIEADSSSFHKLSCNECLRGHCKSSSSAECSIGMSYQEGSSWSAYEVRDECYVGGMHEAAVTVAEATGHQDDLDPFVAPDFAFPLKFGCQTHLTGLFKTQLADGIMGMDNAEAAFWAQMAKQLGMAQKFALCFGRSPTASRTGTNAGAMTMGGSDDRLHESDMVFSATDEGRGFYNVHVSKVYLRLGGGDSALSQDDSATVQRLDVSDSDLNRGGVIVDSGTTDTYYNRAIGDAFKQVWKQLVGADYSHSAVDLTEEELHALPTVLFQISGDVAMNQGLADLNPGRKIVGLAGDLDPENPYDVILAMPASHFYEFDTRTNKYTSRFYVDEGGGSVLGANAMMGHDVFFDVDNHRVGWAESTCDYEKLVEPFVKAGALVPPPVPTRQDHPDGEPSDFDSNGNGASCSSASCRFTAMVAVLAFVAVVLVVVVRSRSRRSKIRYTVADSELELREARDAEDGDFASVSYRDHPVHQTSALSDDGSGTESYASANPFMIDDEEEMGVLT